MKKLRIILADDHVIVREGLRLLLDRDPELEVVAEAGDGTEVLRKVFEFMPNIVVMDLTMPLMNGLQATAILKAKHPAIKVVALTVHEDVNYLRQVAKVGSDGYVLKRSAGEQLIQAIHAVADGGAYFDATLASKALVPPPAAQSRNGPPPVADLSAQEETVLTLLAWGHSHKEIAAKLALSIKTVETYKARVREKLGIHSRAEMVQYALRQGWLQDAEPRP